MSQAHQRYQEQANWTRALRQYIFGKIGLAEETRVLEVGCGTGAILAEMDIPAYGLDLQLATVKEAKRHTRGIHRLSCADAFSLPFADERFDVIYTHFLFLWLPNPLLALAEMKRVTRAGGQIIAFAEPDYSQRVDEPAELKPLGKWQQEALEAQGANTTLGAQLAALFSKAGIQIIERGSLSKSGDDADSPNAYINEWLTLEADLRGRVPASNLQNMKKLDEKARTAGKRVLYVPTYFCWGQRGE